MRRPLRARAACVAVLAAAVGCSGGGAEVPPDPAAAVARSLQGEWDGPCLSSGTRPWRRNQYTFSGSDLRFSVWGFDSPLCDGSGLLLDRGSGAFAIRSSLTAAVEGAGFDVTAWQLDVTWTTGAVSRTAVAITDPREPEPFVMFAAWDAEAVSSTLGPPLYRKTGQPAFVFGAAILGTWARCVSATRAEFRGFSAGLLYDDYSEGFFTFEDACLGRRSGTDDLHGEWELGSPIVARLDAALVTGHVVHHRLNSVADGPWRTQTAFVARAADGDALYLSELSDDAGTNVRTISSARGAWVRANYTLPPAPPAALAGDPVPVE